MNDNSPFLQLPWVCDQAVRWLEAHLVEAGMRVIRSFDLRSARVAEAGCPCPYHGTAQCDCQMVVLLVYLGNRGPVSIIAHGQGQQTWLVVVDTAEQPADPFLVAALNQAVDTALSPYPFQASGLSTQ